MDKVGKVYGKMTVMTDLGKLNGIAICECKCSCGNVVIARWYNLTSGNTKSCGCLSREVCSSIGKSNKIHGKSHSTEYRSWHSMIQRCYNPANNQYHHYGGRGIKVDPRWRTFANFYKDMGDKPSMQHSLDRIDNNGDYCPENCRWASEIVQKNNMRSNTRVTIEGKTHTVAEWSRLCGIKYNTMISRLRKNPVPTKALLAPTNMLKADGPVVNGKKMKPPGWVGPDLKSIIEGEDNE